MRDACLPWSVCLSLTAIACPQSDDDAGTPAVDEPKPEPGPEPGPEPTSEPTSEPATPTTTDDPSSSSSSTTTTDDATASSTTASDDSTTDALPPPGCGDGIVVPPEACDLGFGLNHDQDSDCTQTCQLPFCGDGLVRTGQEACDHGLSNNSQIYGGCSESCTLNARCGDGKLQPEHEECDATAPPIEGHAPCGAACDHDARLAFVTAATYSGQIFGLQSADNECALAAAAVGLDNAANYRAWLGDAFTGPATRFTDGLKAKGFPYARRDGTLIANDLASLFMKGPLVPIDITETGEKLPPGQYAWTNLKPEGVPSSATNHCQTWSSAAAKDLGGVGQVSPEDDSDLALFEWLIGAHWTRYITASCKTNNGTIHLYCFED